MGRSSTFSVSGLWSLQIVIHQQSLTSTCCSLSLQSYRRNILMAWPRWTGKFLGLLWRGWHLLRTCRLFDRHRSFTLLFLVPCMSWFLCMSLVCVCSCRMRNRSLQILARDCHLPLYFQVSDLCVQLPFNQIEPTRLSFVPSSIGQQPHPFLQRFGKARRVSHFLRTLGWCRQSWWFSCQLVWWYSRWFRNRTFWQYFNGRHYTKRLFRSKPLWLWFSSSRGMSASGSWPRHGYSCFWCCGIWKL